MPADAPACHFLLHDLGAKVSGVERACLKRANLFVHHLGVPPRILTTRLNLELRNHWQHYQYLGWVDPQVCLLNPYDELLQLERGAACPPASLVLHEGWQIETLAGGAHQQVRDERGRLRQYVVWSSADRARLAYINHFHQGRKVRREQFNRFGQLALSQHLGEGGQVLHEAGFDPQGRRRLARAYDAQGRVYRIECFNGHGLLQGVFATEDAWFGYWLEQQVQGQDNVFVVDGGPHRLALLQPLLQQRRQRVWSVLHGNHLQAGADALSGPLVSRGRAELLASREAVEACIVFTQQQHDEIKARFPQGCRLVTLPHANETGPQPVPFERRDPDCLVALVRLSEEKRVDEMVRIMAGVVRQLPGKKLHIYGAGPEEPRLRQLIRELDVEDNVLLMGYVEQIAPLLEKAVFSLLTSRVESFAMAVAESLNHGCPVLAYDIRYGPSSMIEHGCNGWLVEEGDVGQAVNHLVECLADHERLRSLSAHAYRSAEAYAPESLARRWQALLEGR